MTSFSTRFFCAVLSMAGATGLVALSVPAAAFTGRAAPAPAVAIAAVPATALLAQHG